MDNCGSIIMFSAHIKSKRYVHNHKGAVGSFLYGSTQDVSQLLTCWEGLFFSLKVDFKKVYFFRVTWRKTKPPTCDLFQYYTSKEIIFLLFSLLKFQLYRNFFSIFLIQLNLPWCNGMCVTQRMQFLCHDTQ